ncbi:hypothetical protein [Rhodococcus sp. PSBB049]|uniref:allene oxide cyclase barrel-like domain-containing protein n=1 Tax=Rhodococcus sp. PSBB049 TaxID=2812863 RepID=UPI00198266AE|nr:hypothetical protein [Rhodococcus sp. PSBB049]QSE72422.1 hypothetical protein JYA91_29255 [Rhodococcus sp. PSBB049]
MVVFDDVRPAAADSVPDPITVHVENDQVAKHDFGASGLDVGDVDVFSDILSRDGQQVGHDGGVCWFTNIAGPDSPITHCVLTIQFEDGQIFAQGLGIHTTAPFGMTITGGTGRYAGLGGEITVSGVATPDEKYEIRFEGR